MKVSEFGRMSLVPIGIMGFVIAAIFVLIGDDVVLLEPEAAERRLLAPVFAMFGLTALVWLVMVIARNAAIAAGRAEVSYYLSYVRDVPEEWIERPARTFNNLMQVPVLFYLVVALILITNRIDLAQVNLAWLFVSTRCLHAFVYITLNRIEYRFGFYAAGCITLGVMWLRFGLQTFS